MALEKTRKSLPVEVERRMGKNQLIFSSYIASVFPIDTLEFWLNVTVSIYRV